MGRLIFGLSVLRRRLARQSRDCPNCGAGDSELVGTKKILLELRKCGTCLARMLGTRWGPMINEKHSFALTAEFFERELPALGFDVVCYASPYNEIIAGGGLSKTSSLDGDELLVIARPRAST